MRESFGFGGFIVKYRAGRIPYSTTNAVQQYRGEWLPRQKYPRIKKKKKSSKPSLIFLFFFVVSNLLRRFTWFFFVVAFVFTR